VEAAQSPSVRLFVERAQQVNSTFELAARNTADVVSLLRKLDGIPLAIELAAARMGVMTPAEANARLDEGMGALDPSLATALEWSWALLTATEQRALARCSVVKGTFTLDAFRAVTAEDVDVLQALVDKSLIARVPSEKRQRFRLYAAVSEYAEHKLGDARTHTSEKWRHWLLHRAQTLGQGLDTHDDAISVEELSLEQENLIHLVRDACARSDATSALQGVLALDPLLSRRGPLDVHVALLDAALSAAASSDVDPVLLARALEARGRVRQHRGHLEACMADLTRAAEMATQHGDTLTCARALAEMAALHRRRGSNAQAQALFSRAVELVKELGDARTEGRIHAELGIMHKEQGDMAEARTHYERALQLLREAGDRRHEGRVIMDLGALHQEEGRMTEARVCFKTAVRMHEEGGNKRFEALARSDLGSLELEQGLSTEAEAQLSRAVKLLEEMGDRRTGARFEGILAAALAQRDDLTRAAAAFDRAETELTRVGDVLFLCAVRIHRGQLDLAHQRAASNPAEAEQHLNRARARLLQGTQLGHGGEASPSERSDDVRLAMRVLRNALAAASPGAPTLLVGP